MLYYVLIFELIDYTFKVSELKQLSRRKSPEFYLLNADILVVFKNYETKTNVSPYT